MTADCLTSKTPMRVGEFDEIGVKRNIADVAEFPDSDMQPMVFADLGGRIGQQVQSSPTQVPCSKEWDAVGRAIREAAMLPSPLALWIDSHRRAGFGGCGNR